RQCREAHPVVHEIPLFEPCSVIDAEADHRMNGAQAQRLRWRLLRARNRAMLAAKEIAMNKGVLLALLVLAGCSG
ncbi:hypothetical protein, partial [Escherichia coli]|uniref:hypothetical protein n=1 Tax=Escherichia coli TaxID=562 RepID=UPI001954D228